MNIALCRTLPITLASNSVLRRNSKNAFTSWFFTNEVFSSCQTKLSESITHLSITLLSKPRTQFNTSEADSYRSPSWKACHSFPYNMQLLPIWMNEIFSFVLLKTFVHVSLKQPFNGSTNVNINRILQSLHSSLVENYIS